MLVDLHAHTSGISKCCRMSAEGVVEEAAKNGIDGIAVTNHYQKSYIDGRDDKTFAQKYIDEMHFVEEVGRKAGVKVFGGIELSPEMYPNVHILIYGVSDEFIVNNSAMFEYTQRELYEKVKNVGGTVVQAHPFRNGTSVTDTRYLDGIEINCHPIYKKSFSEEIMKIAYENDLAVTCGGDFHADMYRPKCGIYLPETVRNSREMGEYIVTAKELKMCVQEPENAEITDMVYRRPANRI